MLTRLRESSDGLHIYVQSGVIPVRFDAGGWRALLITTRKKKRWVIPKGLVEPAMTPQSSAAKEALEEAGVLGTVHPHCVGMYDYRKWGGVCRVSVYLMLVESVLDSWLEQERDRRWLPLAQTASWVREPGLQKVLTRVAADLGDASQIPPDFQ
ncbi:NUDIX hydrolase [Magnetofaba australis]|nr:NUDIX hydrolase [Magnetofaba australis]